MSSIFFTDQTTLFPFFILYYYFLMTFGKVYVDKKKIKYFTAAQKSTNLVPVINIHSSRLQETLQSRQIIVCNQVDDCPVTDGRHDRVRCRCESLQHHEHNQKNAHTKCKLKNQLIHAIYIVAVSAVILEQLIKT